MLHINTIVYNTYYITIIKARETLNLRESKQGRVYVSG